MKNLMIITSILLIFLASGCKSEEVVLPAAKTTYDLIVQDMLGVTGTVTFTKTTSSTATIDIELTGAPVGTHPAELSSNSAVEGGTTALLLNPVGLSGKSSTLTSSMTYKQLIAYDGFVQVHLSSMEPNQIIAIGDIGGNEITTTNISYPLSTVGGFGITGTALFEKRVNGNTLLTLTMNGLLTNTNYPSTLNIGSIATIGGGDIKKSLNDVDGNTGKSSTNIRSLNNNIAISYENWLVYVGYINVYHTEANNLNIISQGNIGAN